VTPTIALKQVAESCHSPHQWPPQFTHTRQTQTLCSFSAFFFPYVRAVKEWKTPNPGESCRPPSLFFLARRFYRYARTARQTLARLIHLILPSPCSSPFSGVLYYVGFRNPGLTQPFKVPFPPFFQSCRPCYSSAVAMHTLPPRPHPSRGQNGPPFSKRLIMSLREKTL